MNFSIEVPGEASPLTPQEVFFALQKASSSDQQSIQSGTKQLQTWETQQGYYSTLQAAYLDRSLPTEIRYLAIIQLKNGIDKYWRKNASNAITPEEKALIRSRLLQGGIEEPSAPLALQNAFVVSKVARSDYPAGWPDLFTILIDQLRRATDQGLLQKLQIMLHQIVKELASARLRKSQTDLQAVTPELIRVLDDRFSENVERWSAAVLGGSSEDEGTTIMAMQNSLASLKIIRRLMIVGYEAPWEHEYIQKMYSNYNLFFTQHLTRLVGGQANVESHAKELVGKHLLQISKLHLGMATTHMIGFSTMMLIPKNQVESLTNRLSSDSRNLADVYWNLIVRFGDLYGSETQDFNSKAIEDAETTRDKKPVLESLSLRGLTLFRACIKAVYSPAPSFKYRSVAYKEAHQRGISTIKSLVFTNDQVVRMVNVIITKFFVFRQVDLLAWEENEDEWEIQEEGGGDSWEFEIRPCAEQLFLDLVKNFKELLAGQLLSTFQSVGGTNEISVVQKDTIYTAMGLAAPVVFQSFDFDSFLKTVLTNDVLQTGPGYKVLRRRIAILLSQWITIRISEANRPLVYQIFQHLLNKDDETNDRVVRITAARKFKIVVDDFSFDPTGFLPYASEILGRILALIQEVEATETRMALLDTIRMIAVRLELNIAPFGDQIVAVLPGLWDASGEEHLLKQAILTILATLTDAMKEQSQRYHPLVLPLIKRAVEPGSEVQLYLMEEALELWSAILAQTPAPASAELLELAECAFPFLEYGSDGLRNALSIVESYILLAPAHMLGDTIRMRVLSHMASILGTVSKRELAGQVTSIVEDMIRAAEGLAGSNGVTQIAKDLHGCGFIQKIFEGLHDAWTANQTTGPDRKYPKTDDVVRTDYFTILARISLADPAVFTAVLSSFGTLNEVWAWLSTEWFHHFDSMANIDRQKLSCLALTRLLEPESGMTQLVLEKLQDYFSMWIQVISEVLTDEGGDSLIWAELTDGTEPLEGPEDARKRLQGSSDPVHTIHTLTYVSERLAVLINAVGGPQEFENSWLVNVDKDVLKQYQRLGEVKHVE